MSELQTRWNLVNTKISQKSETARLVVVTKKKPISLIKELLELGQMDFGENYVQEWKEKAEFFKDTNISWHFIGQLQTNKIKELVGKVEFIHSVCKAKQVDEIDKRATLKSVTQKILLQVDYEDKDGRGGALLSELSNLIELCKIREGICLVGLMTVPPVSENSEDAGAYFTQLADLLQQLKVDHKLGDEFEELSMGMSGDFESAMSAGATILRLGSVIVGDRKG